MKYTEAMIEVIELQAEDVVATSCATYCELLGPEG